MKKIVLLIVAFIVFANVSYASFPITETQQTEIVETNNAELPTYKSGNPTWGILSLVCALLSLMLILNPLVATIIALLGVVFGAIGFNKKLKGLAITGFILSLIIFLVSAFLAFVIFAFGGDPTKLGG
jgi:hypothetical protein